MNFSRKMNYQYNDHERIRSKFLKNITKIMITNDWSIIHYQDNDNEAFLGRVITGNDHSAHDHIHYLQRLGFLSYAGYITDFTIDSGRKVKYPEEEEFIRNAISKAWNWQSIVSGWLLRHAGF